MSTSGAPAYLSRIVDVELDALFAELPALSLEGPKGVGKTATGRRRVRTVIALDDAQQRALAEASPEQALRVPTPVLIDEWQRVPGIWDAVRRAVDASYAPGQFLLAGSAVPRELPVHSGAGRIVQVRMRPLALAERGLETPTVSLRALLSGTRPDIGGSTQFALADYAREIVSSGFPAIRRQSPLTTRRQIASYLRLAVDRDVREYGVNFRRPEQVLHWMTAYAAATSTTTSLEKIRSVVSVRGGDEPSKLTTLAYREVLERLWLLDAVPGWTPTRNALARLTQAPKHHLADPALAAHLLGADAAALVQGTVSGAFVPRHATLLGQLFESLVTQSVRVYAQAAEADTYHLRTQEGRQEIDLIIQRHDQRVLALEVKLNPVVNDEDVRHLRWLQKELGDDVVDAAVITTGRQAYRREDGIAVIPAALLGL